MAQVVDLLVCTNLSCRARGHDVGSLTGVSLKFSIVRIIIPACKIKQPNGSLSWMYVQTNIRVKWAYLPKRKNHSITPPWNPLSFITTKAFIERDDFLWLASYIVTIVLLEHPKRQIKNK